jgi:FKBP-type peptidyl-prolyl cis-trans isomerase (trigger factor)
MQNKKINDKQKKAETKTTADYKIINKKEEESKLTLEIELAYSELEKHRERAIKSLGQNIEVKGFRKGTAPINLIEKEINESKIIEEMSYQAIVVTIQKVVADEKINALTQPKISVKKLAPGNSFIFNAEFILMPTLKLPDYKKIAKSVPPIKNTEVTDKEISDYIDYVRSSKAQAENLRKKTSVDQNERAEATKKKTDKPESKLPELTDDFVKTLGDFKDVADFKTQLKKNMTAEKRLHETQKRRLEIIEKVIAESEINIPDIMVEEELNRMLQQFKGDIAQAKMEFSEYLNQIKKTEEHLLKEWRPDAIKRSKMNLVLPKIAMEEKLEADPAIIEKEVEHLKKHYPDINDSQARSYVSHILRNDEVFKFLENIK